jgi:hypothetical protein
MTDEPKFKRSGPFLIPADWEDETPKGSGSQIAIIGGISPAQVKPQQDRDQLERDDDKADEEA